MQVIKDEVRHKILTEAQHLFLQRGYDRTSLQMIAEKVNISKSNLYRYFDSKEALFYELTDSAAEGLKRLILRLRDKRFDPQHGAAGIPVFAHGGNTAPVYGGEIRPAADHGAGAWHTL